MRIGLVVPGGVHPSGTREVIPALLSLIERLAGHHEVRVLALGHSRTQIRYPLCGALVVDVGQGYDARLRAAAFFRERFDVIHAFWAQRPGVVAGLAGRARRTPVVLSIGGGELVWIEEIGYGGRGKKKERAIADLALRLADRITAGSRFAIKQVPVARPVEWLPLGADRRRFFGSGFSSGFGSIDRGSPREGEPWRLLTVADRNRVKDPWTLLEALRIVAASRSDVVLDWVGADTLGGAVERRAAEIGLGSRIRFLGFLEQDALPAIFAQAHVYVQSSRYESQGVAVLEAALFGLPIAGTSVGLVAELAPKAAIAVPPAEPGRLAEAILVLLGSAERRGALSEAGRRFALEHDADWTALRVQSMYEALVRERR